MEFHRILGTAAAVSSLRAFGAFIQFCFLLFVARQTGVEDFGLFSMALTLTIMSSMVARWGADQWVLRELPATLVKGSSQSFVSVLINGAAFVLGASLLVTLVFWIIFGSVVSPSMYKESGAERKLFDVMALSILPFAMVNFFAESLRATGHHLLATILQTVLVPFLSVLILGGFYLTSKTNLALVAVSYVSACSVVLVVGALFLRKIYKVHAGFGGFVWLLKKMTGETTPIAMVVLLSAWLAYADILVLGYFQGPSEVGLYSAAQRIVLLLSFALVSLNSVLGPRFALLIKQGKEMELFALYRRSVQWTTMIGLPTVILLAFLSGELLSWFGQSFVAAQNVLLILLFGQLVNVLTGPVGILMMMGQHAAKLRTYTLITVLAHFPLTLVMTPLFGAIGTAIATCVGVVLLNVLCWRFVLAQQNEVCRTGRR